MRLRSLALALAIAPAQYASADFEVVRFLESPPSEQKETSVAVLTIRITGQITESDVTALTTALRVAAESKHKRIIALFVELDSVGGNVASAIQLGRVLRAKGALATVDHGSQCASACVFVLAGAQSRFVRGDVLIHRPYDPNDTLISAADQKKKYSALRKAIAAYLEDVNVSVDLYDDMLRISPEKAKLLSEAELLRYGLSVNDPYEEEASAVEDAQRLQISREEYGRRKARTPQICKMPDVRPENLEDPIVKQWEQFSACEDDVMNGRK